MPTKTSPTKKTQTDNRYTTIRIDRELWDYLASQKKEKEDFNDAIKRIVTGLDQKIWVELVAVDGSPDLKGHTVILKIGEKAFKSRGQVFYELVDGHMVWAPHQLIDKWTKEFAGKN